MTNDLYIKKCRNACNTGTVYTLTWRSRLDDSTQHTEIILSKDINPISEDYIKHILVTMAAHEDLDSLLVAISESLQVQEEEANNEERN